jgi:hypothetical protein
MEYRESERNKAESIRDLLFEDPGSGFYRNQPRPFVLRDAEKNLWEPIRNKAIQYFKENQIVWWPGSITPSGHMLSSQVSCINHLFFLRDDKEARTGHFKRNR